MNLNLGYTQELIKAGKEKSLLRNELAYLLATAYWETAKTMKPVKEAFWLSEDWRKKNLRYYPWYGRGFVQLTWEDNYKRAGKELGVDLTTDPDRVMDPVISAKIIVLGMMEGWFTNRKLSDYITVNKSDYVNARRIVNGTDKAQDIANLAIQYEADLKSIGYGDKATQEPVQEVSKPVEVPTPEVKENAWVRAMRLFIKMLGK